MVRRQQRDVARLTPREREVLEMLRRGYSNRDIADELGISLAGAKYHVSEIISKLGVSSREEAAAWRPRQRGWGFATLPLARIPAWASARLTHHPSVVLNAALALVILSGAGVGGILIAERVLRAGGAGSASSFDACAGIPGCRSNSERRYTTVEEATAHASFVPVLPATLPDNFQPHIVLATDRDVSPSQAANPQAVHNDWITVVYRNRAGNELLISQGFPATPEAVWFAGLDGADSGKSQVNGHEASWVRNRPGLGSPDQGVYRTVLTIFIGRFVTGWGEEGSFFSGSPMTYTIASDSLGLTDLIAIAKSVSFPPIAQPFPDVMPSPYFH